MLLVYCVIKIPAPKFHPVYPTETERHTVKLTMLDTRCATVPGTLHIPRGGGTTPLSQLYTLAGGDRSCQLLVSVRRSVFAVFVVAAMLRANLNEHARNEQGTYAAKYDPTD